MRYCAMQYVQRVRRKQREASWAHVQSVLVTLGNITIAWAGIELMLTHLVIWHHVQNRVYPDRGLPRMLAYQIGYLKRSIETDAAFSDDDRAKLTNIRLRLTRLNDFRISVTHGVVHQRNRYTTDWYTHSVKIDGLKWRIVKNRYTNEDIQAKSREISELGSEMSPFIARITGMPHPANSA